jgi:AraC family transcriptional regulator
MEPRLRNDSYFGECQGRFSAAGLLLTERVYPPRFTIPPHAHACSSLCLAVQGSFTETCAGRVWGCSPRMVFLRPRGEVHANRFGEAGGRVFGIELGPAWPARLGEMRPNLERPAVLEGPCLDLALKLHRGFRRADPACPLIVEGLVLEILGEACRTAWSPREVAVPAWLRRARDLLQDRYRQPPSLMELADEVGVHPVHLARVFRRSYGCTVGEYVRRLRIDFACRELARPGRSLVDVALRSGFYDQSQFCRVFKRHVGMTPSQFRRQVRQR